MNLSFVTQYRLTDESWSGTPSQIVKTLRSQNIAVDLVGPLCERYTLPFRALALFQRKAGLKEYLWQRSPAFAKAVSRAALAKIPSSCDAVLSPGTLPIANLKTCKPIVFWTDVTFAGMLDFYTAREKISPQSILGGEEIEQAALDRCSLAIYSSEWARNSAVAHYRVDSSKLRVIPFGANIEWRFTEEEIISMVALRSRDVCRLVFVGVDWYRKGGPFVLEICAALATLGVRVQLTIVGCIPPVATPDYVTVIPRLQKDIPEEAAKFQQIIIESHFLLLPSKADCTPMVIAEANAAGVPCLASNVGGIPEQLSSGKNGRVFDGDDGARDWAEYIVELFSDTPRYQAHAFFSWAEYMARMNWTDSVRLLISEIEAIV